MLIKIQVHYLLFILPFQTLMSQHVFSSTFILFILNKNPPRPYDKNDQHRMNKLFIGFDGNRQLQRILLLTIFVTLFSFMKLFFVKSKVNLT